MDPQQHMARNTCSFQENTSKVGPSLCFFFNFSHQMQISFHKGSRISATLHKANSSRSYMTFLLGATCTFHIHLYVCPRLYVSTAVGRAVEGNREPGETMEGRAGPRGTFTFFDTNITSLLSALAATPHSSSLKTSFESARAEACKKQQVDFSLC